MTPPTRTITTTAAPSAPYTAEHELPPTSHPVEEAPGPMGWTVAMEAVPVCIGTGVAVGVGSLESNVLPGGVDKLSGRREDSDMMAVGTDGVGGLN